MSAPRYRFGSGRLEAVSRVCHAMLGVWARNLKGYPFRERLDAELLAEIKGRLRAPLEAGPVGGRKFRRGEEFPDGVEPWGTRDRTLQVRLGGMDHLEVMMLPQPGCMRWEAGAEAALKVVRDFDRRFEFAHDDRYGFYTASPVSMGSGCHFAVFMQLGGLMATGELQTTERALVEWGFGLRPFEAAGKGRAAGGWYWLETRVSMGLGAWRLVYGLLRAAEEVAGAEMNARQRLFKRDWMWVEDRIGRAMGVLEGARQLGFRESLELLAWLEIAAQSGHYRLSADTWDVFGAVNELVPEPVQGKPIGKGAKLAARVARLESLKYHFHQWRIVQ